MSNQVTNVDIEDVLSSIRRLVAEGDHKNKAVPKPSPSEDAAPDRLVLTPNFRVSEPEAAESSHDTDAPAATESETLKTLPGMETTDDGPTLVLQPEQSIPEGAPVSITSESLEATIAELEARVSDPEQQWEPDGSEVTTEPTWTSAGFTALSPEDFPAEPEDLDPQESAQVTDTATPPPEVLELSEAEVAPEPQAEEVEEPFVPHPRPHRWSEQAERRITTTADDEDALYGDELAVASNADTDDQLERYLEQSPIVDEAMMKRIVQEVLREELQGQLGERITRNVRKLVRREIHNILTTQEFD